MNKAELTQAVRDYLNRPQMGADVVGLFIANVEGALNRLLSEHPRNIKRTNYLQPAQTPLLPFPADLIQLISLFADGRLWRQYPPDTRDVIKHGWIARGMCAELFPVPAVDTTFNLDYHAALKALVKDADANWVSLYFPDVYLYGCLREAAVYLKDDQRLAAWNNEFNTRVGSLSNQGWNQNIATIPRMRCAS
mgnify:CR=1 FL=1